MMRPRLIFAIVSTIIEEVAIAAIVLWGFPEMGISIPLWALILVMLAWVSYSIYTFQKGTIALKIGNIIGMPNMIGSRGKVVRALKPEGMVRIRGELWVATSTSGEMEEGAEVLVVGQKRLKLEVSDTATGDGTEVSR